MRDCAGALGRVASAVLRRFVILLVLLVASCAPEKPQMPAIAAASPAADQDHAVPDKAPAAASPVESKPEAPSAAPRVVRISLQGIAISAVTFDSRTHRIAIVDQAGGPGATFADARAAAASRGGIAAVNGGFFTPEGAPLGLVVSGGKRAGSINRASSLGAGYYSDVGSPALVRRESWSGGASEALQSGPFLLEHGKAIRGLSSASSSSRTFIGWDGGTRWFIARSGACSLAGLAQALAGTEIGGVKARTVLNLDGGRSSDLWISPTVEGGPVTERPFWNKPVRNFLVLVPRR